jgi:hypothetical protein
MTSDREGDGATALPPLSVECVEPSCTRERWTERRGKEKFIYSALCQEHAEREAAARGFAVRRTGAHRRKGEHKGDPRREA